MNEKLISFIKTKGMTKTALSKASGIPLTTLSRILEGKTQKVKMDQMQAIANALGTNVQMVFDIPSLDLNASVIAPDEAGATVTKTLDKNESLLLYWFQNCYADGKAAIMNRARMEYAITQEKISRINPGVPKEEAKEKQDPDYQQLELF